LPIAITPAARLIRIRLRYAPEAAAPVKSGIETRRRTEIVDGDAIELPSERLQKQQFELGQ